jgi:hypothetical protein
MEEVKTLNNKYNSLLEESTQRLGSMEGTVHENFDLKSQLEEKQKVCNDNEIVLEIVLDILSQYNDQKLQLLIIVLRQTLQYNI